MKYIVLSVIVVLVILFKPWELIFAGGILSPGKDSTLIASTENAHKKILLPINHVVSNKDSELEVARRFDGYIEKFMQTWSIRGASFALMKDNKLIYCKGYGYADLEAGIPMDVTNIFRVASISKLITAVGIMKLCEEGKIHLSDQVFGLAGILSDSLYSEIKDPRTKTITIEHLLRHQGGFSIAYGDPMFCPLDVARKMNVTPPANLNTMIRFVISRRLSYDPGNGTAYSNIGYGILSKVIEKVSGQPYEEYIQKNILQEAGCMDIHLGRNTDRLPGEVKYYEVENAELIPACDGSGQLVPRSNGGNNIEELYGAGGWVASPSELLRLLSAIDGCPGIADILQPESIAYMTKNIENSLPIGWIEVSRQGEWLRTGTLAGTSALMKHQSDGYSWVFVTNTSSWKGSRFPHYINTAVTRAMATVPEWPERDLFEYQNPDNAPAFVVR